MSSTNDSEHQQRIEILEGRVTDDHLERITNNEANTSESDEGMDAPGDEIDPVTGAITPAVPTEVR